MAEAKVDGLLGAGAGVTVVSPALTERLASWATEGRIACHRREYMASDCDGQHLAFSATDSRAVTGAVAADARRRGVWVNAAADPRSCDFLLPSVLRRGRLQVAVSTGGASPALAARVRRDLESHFTPEFEDLVELAAKVRHELRATARRAARRRQGAAPRPARGRRVRPGRWPTSSDGPAASSLPWSR